VTVPGAGQPYDVLYRYRAKADRWAAGATAAVFGTILFGGLVAGDWLRVAVLASLLGVVGYRVATIRVVASEDGLVIRNVWRTRRIAWDQVDRFSLGTADVGRYRFPDTGVALLMDGEEVPMHAIAAARVSGERERQAVADLIAALNEEMAQRTGAS